MKTKWSDNELISHRWRIDGRPDVDPLLSRDRPPENAEFEFIHDYNITPPPRGTLAERKLGEPYVWCALCQEPTHWIGWVAEYDVRGVTIRALVGQTCARRKVGEALKRAASSYAGNQERAQSLRARRAVLAIAADVGRGLSDWAGSAGVAAVVDWRTQLWAISSEFEKAVRDAASHEPPTFLVEREVRGPRGPEVEYKAFAKVAGAALYAGPEPTVRIARLKEKFDAAIGGLRQEGLTTGRLKALLMEVRRVAEGCREFQRAYKGCEVALENRAIDTMLAWLDQLPKTWARPDSIRRDGRVVIADRGHWQKPTRHPLPVPAPIVCPDVLDGLEQALLGKV